MVSDILRRVRTLAFAILPLAVAVLPGCKSCGDKGAGNGRTSVAVSIFPIYDLTKRIAGPDADVALLLPAGRNEHSFDPTPKDIESASKAKLGVMVGLNLDPWMEKLLKDAAPNAKILKVGDRVPTLTIKDDPIGADEHDDHDHDHDHAHPGEDDHDEHHDDHDHAKGAPDPHVWLDPQRAQLIVRAIAEELGRVDSAHALAYRERGTALEKELGVLDKEVEEKTKAFKRRGFVTFHGSFSYFAERYKLDILAVIEPFPGSQPTSDYVQKVLEVVKKKNVPALYSEPQLDSRPAKIIADEAKIPLGVLDPVGGQPDTDTYEKMIRFDVAALEKHLK
jgi:zinc transport system substrate-binding protein